MTTLVRELFSIPEQVRKGDFVLKLSEGVQNAVETADTYVVTPPILDAFDKALGLVKSSVADGRSRASYVHGSFGSGKSHFMAMLSLLLSNQEAAWRRGELHPLRDRHPWVKEKKVLQLRYHMVGHPTLEAAIFGEYVRWVRQNRPEATIPPLFADEGLFQDARRLLEKLGDQAFFASMNDETDAEVAEGFGDMVAMNRWSRERFDEAASSTDPVSREKLFSALAKSHFQSFADQRQSFVDIDSGLATMARHAKGLGFDAVVLFLDELVLWLASGASNASWLHTEVQKTAKLVEAQDASREIAIVSFIARQRNLADLVGKDLAGAENQRLIESLEWFKGRFDVISLEDRNLPEIVHSRILRPKSDEAKETLEQAFTKLQRGAGSAWTTLLGQEDATAFKKLYPFSPALVETLVALSSSLQRNRTAIRLLMEILVDHIHDLPVGDVVGVGDLFDVLAGGDDTADGVMKALFESAKHLYRHQLLPLLHETHGTGSAEKCQRLRADHRQALGCSGCVQKACRADNRLVKTMLLAALVREVPALKELTAGKLVQLNHGTLRAPVPGTEAAMAAQRLRVWGSQLGQIRVGDQMDPTVSIDVGGVDLEPILQQHREADAPLARQRIIGRILFESLGLGDGDDWGIDDAIEWRGTKRKGHVRFGNVRRMGPEVLRCPEDHDWRLVLDYPFDDPGFGPNEDLSVIERLRDEGGGTWTLVLLPSFFSEAMNRLLGELTILEEICRSAESKQRAVRDLRVEQQQNALLGLENLRSQKRARLHSALMQAYGFTRETEHDIDTSRALTTHLYVLVPETKIQLPIGASLSVLREEGIGRMLEKRYPRHPALRKITSKVAQRVLEVFGQLVEADEKEKRISADKDDVEKVSGTLGALGIVRTVENAIVPMEDRTLQQLEQKRAQRNVEHPSAAEIRSWLDPEHQMGLQAEASNLVLRAYARWSARTLSRYGKPFEGTWDAEIPDDVTLEKPVLPTQEEWQRALATAGAVFAITFAGRALHGDNLRKLEGLASVKVKDLATAATALPATLGAVLAELGLPPEADRLRTAESGKALIAALQGKGALETVRVLAGFEAVTSAKALQKSLESASDVVKTLNDPLVRKPLRRLREAGDSARGAFEDVAKVLRVDEIHEVLVTRLKTLAEVASDLAAPVSHAGEGAGAVAGSVVTLGPLGFTANATVSSVGSAKRAEVGEVAERLARAFDLTKDPPETEYTVTVTVTRKGRA